MTPYQGQIAQILRALGRADVDPAHVEGWMRLERGTLDALSAAQFRAEVRVAVACVDASKPADNEALAVSYGLRRAVRA